MSIDVLTDYRLAGGTGLSLQLGHRKSVDIDLFSENYQEGKMLKSKIISYFPRTEIRDLSFGITMYLKEPNSKNELKVDIMSTDSFIKADKLIDGIRFASIEEIAAMKLEAITNRKEKKDYWDIAALLQTIGIEDLIKLYKLRYPWNDIRSVFENLVNFTPCHTQPNPIALNDFTWNKVQEIIQSNFKSYFDKKMEL